MNFIRLTDLAASPGAFETVRVSLEKVTAETRALEAKLAATNAKRAETPKLPTVEELAVLVLDLEGRIADDPTSAREALRQSLDNGRLYMEPMPDRAYRAHSLIFPMRPYWRMRIKKPRADGSGEASSSHRGERQTRHDSIARREVPARGPGAQRERGDEQMFSLNAPLQRRVLRRVHAVERCP